MFLQSQAGTKQHLPHLTEDTPNQAPNLPHSLRLPSLPLSLSTVTSVASGSDASLQLGGCSVALDSRWACSRRPNTTASRAAAAAVTRPWPLRPWQELLS